MSIVRPVCELNPDALILVDGPFRTAMISKLFSKCARYQIDISDGIGKRPQWTFIEPALHLKFQVRTSVESGRFRRCFMRRLPSPTPDQPLPSHRDSKIQTLAHLTHFHKA
jgi:hypothetical protein